MSDVILREYDETAVFPQPVRAKSGYGTSLKREQTPAVDPRLSAYILALENEVIGKIGGGVHRPLTKHSLEKGLRPVFATHETLRSSSQRKPLPEARSWCYFFLNHAPEFRLSTSSIGRLYRRDASTVWQALYDLPFILRENKKVYYKLDWIARELEAKGFAPPPIADLIGIERKVRG